MKNNLIKNASTKHGLHGIPEYFIWKTMKARCSNPNDSKWNDYGGRGIRVYPGWVKSFEMFFKYIGPRPSPKHSIDRYPDNDGNYEPGNVRWATPKEQGSNTRKNRWITFRGKTRTLAEWSRLLGLKVETLRHRLDDYGWPLSKALSSKKYKPYQNETVDRHR